MSRIQGAHIHKWQANQRHVPEATLKRESFACFVRFILFYRDDVDRLLELHTLTHSLTLYRVIRKMFTFEYTERNTTQTTMQKAE